MNQLGEFQKNEFGDMNGKIVALGLPATPVIFDPDFSKKDSKPYYRIVANPLGEAQVIGVAFAKEANGRTFYTVTLDSPVFPAPVHALLFPRQDNPNVFDLVWDRPETAKSHAEPRTTRGSNGQRRFTRTAPNGTPSHA